MAKSKQIVEYTRSYITNHILPPLFNPIKNQERDIPRVMTVGLLLVTVAYILANLSYFCVLNTDDIEGTDSIAIDFAHMLGGTGGFLAGVLALGVAMSTIGAANGSIMTGGRAYMVTLRLTPDPNPWP